MKIKNTHKNERKTGSDWKKLICERIPSIGWKGKINPRFCKLKKNRRWILH